MDADTTNNAPRQKIFSLPPPSPQTRAASQAAKRARVAAGAHFKRDHKDQQVWEILAKTRGLRLPPWYQPPTSGRMAHWLKKLGVPSAAYLAWSGEHNLTSFAKNNPHWSLRAWIGLVLEAMDADLFTPPTPSDPSTDATPDKLYEKPLQISASLDTGDGRSEVLCRRCGRRSGQEVPPNSGSHSVLASAVTDALRPKGWRVLHGGYLGIDGDARCWVCPTCIPAWRDGHALSDLKRLGLAPQGL